MRINKGKETFIVVKLAEQTQSKHEHNAGKMRLLQLDFHWSVQCCSRPIGRREQKHLQKTVSQILLISGEDTNSMKILTLNFDTAGVFTEKNQIF